jgi:hypothetical protein
MWKGKERVRMMRRRCQLRLASIRLNFISYHYVTADLVAF